MSLDDDKPSSWILVAVIVAIVIGVFLMWTFFFIELQNKDVTSINEEPVIIEAPEAIEPSINEQINVNANIPLPEKPITIIKKLEKTIKPEVQLDLPELNESDSWVKEKLSSIIWRKELLGLLINEDMIRRFVVFVDNFSQGNIAYSHSPFIKPLTPFMSKEGILNRTVENDIQQWQFDESSFKRFSLYVDLFRSADAETLVEWYKELQPLINQAYSELGYPDRDFEQVLQIAITKVLDLEFPKEDNQLVRPSVMYRYKSAEIESIDDADKLMLRVGKDNLLIIKSVLLEINEKIHKID